MKSHSRVWPSFLLLAGLVVAAPPSIVSSRSENSLHQSRVIGKVEHFEVDVCHGPTVTDCLSVLVSRPVGTSASSSLPVLVSIHDLLSQADQCDPTSLLDFAISIDKPVLHVSVDCRPARPKGPGSALLNPRDINEVTRDQLLILEWISKHISRHGGDGRRVTVVGQTSSLHDILHDKSSTVPFQQLWSTSHPLVLFPRSQPFNETLKHRVNIVVSWLDDGGDILISNKALNTVQDVRDTLALWLGKDATPLSPYRHLSAESIEYILHDMYPLSSFNTSSEKTSAQFRRTSRILRDALYITPSVTLAWQNHLQNPRSNTYLLALNTTKFPSSPAIPSFLSNAPTFALAETYAKSLLNFAHTGSPNPTWPRPFTKDSLTGSDYPDPHHISSPPPTPFSLSLHLLHPESACLSGPATVTYDFPYKIGECGTAYVSHEMWSQRVIWGPLSPWPVPLNGFAYGAEFTRRLFRTSITAVGIIAHATKQWFHGNTTNTSTPLSHQVRDLFSSIDMDPTPQEIPACDLARHTVIAAQTLPSRIIDWQKFLYSNFGGEIYKQQPPWRDYHAWRRRKGLEVDDRGDLYFGEWRRTGDTPDRLRSKGEKRRREREL